MTATFNKSLKQNQNDLEDVLTHMLKWLDVDCVFLRCLVSDSLVINVLL